MNSSRHEQLRQQAAALRGLERIVLVGCSGAGKSTLSRWLGPALGLPVVHLDREFWLPGWVEPDRDQWRQRVAELLAEPHWVMDGNFSNTFEQRVERAQAVIFLDFPRWLCINRVLGRVVKDYGRTRADMTPGCNERFDWGFMVWIWNYPRRSRPKIVEILNRHQEHKQMLILRHPAEIDILRQGLEESGPLRR